MFTGEEDRQDHHGAKGHVSLTIFGSHQRRSLERSQYGSRFLHLTEIPFEDYDHMVY